MKLSNTGGTVSSSSITVLTLKYKFIIYVRNLHSELGCAPQTNAPDKRHRYIRRQPIRIIGAKITTYHHTHRSIQMNCGWIRMNCGWIRMTWGCGCGCDHGCGSSPSPFRALWWHVRRPQRWPTVRGSKTSCWWQYGLECMITGTLCGSLDLQGNNRAQRYMRGSGLVRRWTIVNVITFIYYIVQTLWYMY